MKHKSCVSDLMDGQNGQTVILSRVLNKINKKLEVVCKNYAGEDGL